MTNVVKINTVTSFRSQMSEAKRKTAADLAARRVSYDKRAVLAETNCNESRGLRRKGEKQIDEAAATKDEKRSASRAMSGRGQKNSKAKKHRKYAKRSASKEGVSRSVSIRRSGEGRSERGARGSDGTYSSRLTKTRGSTKAAGGSGTSGAQAAIINFINSKRILCIVLCVVLLLVVAVYPLARGYYGSIRDGQRTQAQIEAVEAANAAVAEANEALQTDEGVATQAQEDYGYVSQGEQAVVVVNAPEEDASSSDAATSGQVDVDAIHAPSTWYYTILDIMFLYSESSSQ